jgi:L-rhamnose mutarotase
VSVQRHLKLVNVLPEKREQYFELHSAVWPDVQARIAASNITNYSIFIEVDLRVAYFKYVGSDFESDVALIAADPITREWWSHTDPCQVPFPSAEPGQMWRDAQEVWHLA